MEWRRGVQRGEGTMGGVGMVKGAGRRLLEVENVEARAVA